MSIQQLNIQAKTAVSLFLLFVITATISSVILLGLELSGKKRGLNIPTISQIKNQYTTPTLVAAMRGNMYEHVSADEDIDTVNAWIQEGAKKEGTLYEESSKIIKQDCTNCHSKSSKMTKAIPSMPFDTYEQVLSHTDAGYSWSKMSKQAHIHMFGISTFLVLISLLFAYTTYKETIKNVLIIGSFGGAFLDIFSWWFSKFVPELVYLIFIMGGLMVSSILLMSLLVLANIWKKQG
ncbi:MAG: hypothetical protein PHN18_09200 [Sulfurospirillaceae bacterium]|nr:hypothetical protein [Sulfurospirillaceae bacterium]MDD2826712.1 hypothetical protein [Sulfurospirillaceae bacterium]